MTGGPKIAHPPSPGRSKRASGDGRSVRFGNTGGLFPAAERCQGTPERIEAQRRMDPSRLELFFERHRHAPSPPWRLFHPDRPTRIRSGPVPQQSQEMVSKHLRHLALTMSISFYTVRTPSVYHTVWAKTALCKVIHHFVLTRKETGTFDL